MLIEIMFFEDLGKSLIFIPMNMRVDSILRTVSLGRNEKTLSNSEDNSFQLSSCEVL